MSSRVQNVLNTLVPLAVESCVDSFVVGPLLIVQKIYENNSLYKQNDEQRRTYVTQDHFQLKFFFWHTQDRRSKILKLSKYNLCRPFQTTLLNFRIFILWCTMKLEKSS